MNHPHPGALLLAALMIPACGPDSRSSASRNENLVLMERVDQLQGDLKRANDEARAAERSLQTVREEAVRKEREATAEREDTKKKLEEAVKAFEDYKTKYRVSFRNKAAGLTLSRLEAGPMGSFDNVSIVSLTPGELRFQHANGIATVSLGQLASEQRDQLGYDAEEAAAWLAARAAREEDSDSDDALLRDTKTASAQIASLKKPASGKAPKGATGAKGLFQANLNEIYIRARALQADRNACPVHKRYQLAAWQRTAAKLKQKIAALP